MTDDRFRRGLGGVNSLGLHIVWCPKYSKGILLGLRANRLDALFREIVDERGWNIVASEVMPEHVDIFVKVGPTDSPAEVARAFKGRSSRVPRTEFPRRRRQRVLWSKSYFVASVGYVSEPTVRRHIEHQRDRVA